MIHVLPWHGDVDHGHFLLSCQHQAAPKISDGQVVTVRVSFGLVKAPWVAVIIVVPVATGVARPVVLMVAVACVPRPR